MSGGDPRLCVLISFSKNGFLRMSVCVSPHCSIVLGQSCDMTMSTLSAAKALSLSTSNSRVW